ncbi:hypothetical protein M436DRAFT_62348 [Aureobasidium namibiae CBS 147.97]|uniref:Uncharacterized protein n=1 Tax=Aureobasidium namibiae CBS 147.97 TaxID=1043004 RepID=A0A074WP60_9PEZI
MKVFGLTFVVALLGSTRVIAAPVDPPAETQGLSNFISSVISQYSRLGPYPTFNSSTIAHHTSKHHKSGKGKYKTKTVTVTEDCDDNDDDESFTTSVEISESTPVTVTAQPTVTKTVIRIDFETTKSLHKPKHTKHHLTETEVETETETIESASPTVTESSKTHTKHHKSKHTKSKHHKSKHHTKHSSSETVVETPVPTLVQSSSQSLSQSASDTSKEEVVVVTTEEVEVITTGVEEIVSTITLSEGETRLSTLSKASPTSSSTVTTSDFEKFYPFLTSDLPRPTETPEFNPLFDPPRTPTFPSELFPYPTTQSSEDDTTTHTRSGHKTKEPPSIFSEVYPFTSVLSKMTPPSSISSEEAFQPSFTPDFVYTMVDPISTITTAPEFPLPATWSADDATETLVARDSAGDPKKKHDKMVRPDKAISKRMSRWSKHHSKLLEKSWSAHTKYMVKSLEQQMEYDAKHSKKDHKTTLAAVLPVASAIADANAAALVAREEAVADEGDPEKDYRRKMSLAKKVYNKFSSYAENQFEKENSKEQKKASKKRAKSIAKQNKKEEKFRKKAIKSRIKHQKGDDDYEKFYDGEEEDLVVFADVEVRDMTTPATGVPARATVTATVTTVVGGPAGNGTLSTSWRSHHASQTASVSTAGW